MSWERNVSPNSPPRLGGVAAPPRKWSRSLLAQTGWSFPNTFRGLTTPSAPTLVAFGIILLMARPPLLCKEWNMFLFNIHPSKPCALGTLTRHQEDDAEEIGRAHV